MHVQIQSHISAVISLWIMKNIKHFKRRQNLINTHLAIYIITKYVSKEKKWKTVIALNKLA